jgi:hypothetical protein
LVAETLQELEQKLPGGVLGELLIYGGAAVAVYLAEEEARFRPTDDIDVDKTDLNLHDAETGLEVRETAVKMWTLSPNFEEDAVDVTHLIGTTQIRVSLVHPYDLVILKMARNLERDYEDCAKLVKHGFVSDLELFNSRLFEAIRHGPTRTTVHRMNFEDLYSDLFGGAELPTDVLGLFSPDSA